MLFNSYEFLFAFLPVTVAVFLLLDRISRNLALGWLVVASLFFYAWWRPANLLIIVPSLLVNFACAKMLLKLAPDETRRRDARLLLIFAIAFNITLLGYFKYANFFKATANGAFGTDFVLTQIILPLGISFITFQMIAFLIDVHGGRVARFSFGQFSLFKLFFPQLIAGPILHFREVMPQFEQARRELRGQDFAVGLTLLALGLFKKVVLADGIAPHVTPIYELAAGGGTVSLLPAWLAAVGFTLQIYFDFAGYSDMATGLARCFGVRFPVNFDSPLKASSIIEFWSRWHVTLTRFLTAYIYNPLLLALTRKRLARGLKGVSGRNTSIGAFLQLIAGPTLLTMFISGFWHGAGFMFILWGIVHGVYLTVNHAWRLVGPQLWPSKESYARFMGPAGFVLTFLAVAAAMVLFRSPTAGVAAEILSGMTGANGIAPPQGMRAYALLAGLLFIALALPNSFEILSRYEPVLDKQGRADDKPALGRSLKWSPTLTWSAIVSVLIVAAVLRVGGESEFLYWQF
jgi:D-alanyl-lipoteichoic acid acyltransferase DltB (MBOAT superfamily)